MTLVVMQKSGKSYVHLERYNSVDGYRINGEPAVPAKGDSGWAVVEGDIRSIEKRHRARAFIKQYRRVEGASERLPETLPADSAEEYDDGSQKSIGGHDPRFYEPEWEAPPDEWIPVEFEVIDRDCEPVEMPSWCIVNWPANVEHYRERQHLYPCYIKVESLFAMCAEKIESIVKQSSGRLSLTCHKNIGTLHVDAVIEIPKEFQKPRRVEYYKSFHAKKMSTKIVTDTTKTIRLFDLNGIYDKPSQGCIQVPRINAANYAELSEKVEEYVESIATLCDPARRCVCQTCGGQGIVFRDECQ